MTIKKLSLKRFFSTKSGDSKGGNAPFAEETLPRSPDAYVEGRLYRIWSWILPLLVGLVFGWFAVVCLGAWLDGAVRQQRPAAPVPDASNPDADAEMMNMSAFLTANPFHVTPMPVPEVSSSDAQGDSVVTITGDLATAILRWPMPEIGAVIESQGKQHLILINESFDVYALESVNYLHAVFRRGDERVVKDFELNPGVRPSAPPDRAQRTPVAASGSTAEQVQAAVPGETDGVINSRMIEQLLENPFDELKKVRLRPGEDVQGLQIQWITKDSILSQLGVQKGDIIRSINGIPFRNMGDITNSMNSLMNSDRFDVAIERGGKTTSLNYVIR